MYDKTQPTNRTNNSNDIDRELAITIKRIKELPDNNEEDEYGYVVKPSEYAIETAIELVSETAKLSQQHFFKAWVLTEDNRGIYLIWSKPDLGKQINVLVPVKEKLGIYLYYDEKAKYGSESNITAKGLSKWINWVNS